jgi:hypothetical protein
MDKDLVVLMMRNMNPLVHLLEDLLLDKGNRDYALIGKTVRPWDEEEVLWGHDDILVDMDHDHIAHLLWANRDEDSFACQGNWMVMDLHVKEACNHS